MPHIIGNIPMLANKLIYHHIGGRWGTFPFPAQQFVRDYKVYLYDADTNAIGAMERAAKQRDIHTTSATGEHLETVCINACLWREDGTAELHHNYDGNTSSLLEADPKYADYSMFTAKRFRGNYLLGQATHTVRSEQLAVSKLDTLIKKSLVESPDYLSIDAEGASLQILEGASECLRTSVVALSAECSFVPLKKDEITVGDLVRYVEKYDFHLVELGELGRLSLAPMRSGIYDPGVPVFFDGAIFVKHPRSISDPVVLRKSAFFLLAHGQLGLMTVCLDRLTPNKIPNAASFELMLDEMIVAWQSNKRFEIPTISETNTYLSYNYGSNDTTANEAMNAEFNLKRQELKKKYGTQENLGLARKDLTDEQSALEAILRRWGFAELANKCQLERKSKASFFLNVVFDIK